MRMPQPIVVRAGSKDVEAKNKAKSTSFDNPTSITLLILSKFCQNVCSFYIEFRNSNAELLDIACVMCITSDNTQGNWTRNSGANLMQTSWHPELAHQQPEYSQVSSEVSLFPISEPSLLWAPQVEVSPSSSAICGTGSRKV